MAALRSLPRSDVGLAAALATYALVEGLLIDARAPWVVGAPLTVLLLAWRRRYPLASVAVVLVLVAPLGAIGLDEPGSVLVLPVIIVSAYTVGREVANGRLALAAAAAIIVWSVVGLLGGENSLIADIVALLVLVGGGAGVGRAIRVSHAENAKLQSLTAQLAAERELVARAAVAEERGRVARELHDVVAHSVSLIAVQAGAAEELMGRDDARARDALRAVQEAARDALAEMRRLLSVLRADEDPPGLAPQPGLGAVEELVAHARRGGLPVHLRQEGVPGDVPTVIDLSTFRIVQEALTNVRKHARAAPTDVLVRYAPDEIVVEVSNADDGAVSTDTNGRGYGIAGMSERARICGGTLDVGRRDGRYVVSARLPRDAGAQ
jgi:signal transduction histidine kinase